MTHAKPPAIRAHHLLKFIYLQLKVEGKSLRALSTGSGVSYNTLKEALQGRSSISLASVEAALNWLGYTMKPTILERKKQ